MPADAVIGAILGDIVGSVHESHWRKVDDRAFPLLTSRSRFTDDTVLTLAVAQAVSMDIDVADALASWAGRYPHAGYGGMFLAWLASDERRPYGSFGNGSAMRVSSVAYASDDLDEVLARAAASAAVTHDHPEGVRGAQAVAGAILTFRLGGSAADVRDLVGGRFGYDLTGSIDDWRAASTFDATCQGTVPAAVCAALDATDLEAAIRNAVFIGGDADTLAAIAGSLAAAAHGVPDDLRAAALARLDEPLSGCLADFERWVDER